MPPRVNKIESLESRRLLSAGELDPFFGSGGIVKPQLDIPNFRFVLDLQPLSNGKILAAASLEHPIPNRPNEFTISAALLQFNRDGSTDLTFGGGDGFVDTGIVLNYRADLTIQPDDKIILSGAPYLARFNPDGSFDTTFGDNGRVLTNASDAKSAILSDGKLLMGGSRFGTLYVQRFNSNGTPDNSFNADSIATVHGVGGATGLSGFELMPNGTMYLGGVWTVVPQNDTEIAVQEFVIVHMRANGTLDTAYGPAGTGISAKRMTVYIGMSGQMLVEPVHERAYFTVFNDLNHMVFRYDRRGALDTTYGIDGVFNARPRAGPDISVDANKVMLQADGAIIAGGGMPSGTAPGGPGPDQTVWNPALSRVTPNGQADLEFGDNGRAVAHLPGAIPVSNDRYASTEAMTIAQDGSILVGAIDRDGTFSLMRFWRDDAPAAELSVRPPTVSAGPHSIVLVVDYRDDGAIDTKQFGNRDLRVTGPNGYVAYAKCDRIAGRSSHGRRVRLRYKLAARDGSWNPSHNGKYTVRLRPNQIADLEGHFAVSRAIGSFDVIV